MRLTITKDTLFKDVKKYLIDTMFFSIAKKDAYNSNFERLKGETQEEWDKRKVIDMINSEYTESFDTKVEAEDFLKPSIRKAKAKKLAKEPSVVAMVSVVESKLLKLFMTLSLKNEFQYETIAGNGKTIWTTETIPQIDADKVAKYINTIARKSLVKFNNMIDNILNDDEATTDINKTLLASELTKDMAQEQLTGESYDGRMIFLKIVQKVVGKANLRNYVKIIKLMGLDTTVMHDEAEIA